MGVNFYADSSEGKLFIPIEKWEHIEGSGGMVSPKVDLLSARVWVDVTIRPCCMILRVGLMKHFRI